MMGYRRSTQIGHNKVDFRDRIFNRVVRVKTIDDARKLREIIHYLALQNELLNFEVEGLREAPHIAKKQQKKDRPLNLQQHV